MYALIPLALIFLDQAWSWFKKNVLGMSDTVVVEGVRPLSWPYGRSVVIRSVNDHVHIQSRVIHITTMEQYKELHQKAKDTKRSVRIPARLPLNLEALDV